MKTIVVMGEPKPKLRPRFTRSGRTYTPRSTAKQEQIVKSEYLKQGGKKLSGAIEAEFYFVYEPPKSLSKKKRETLIGQPKITRPDADNLCKLCLDALNTIAYDDDNQIYKITSQKVYGKKAMTIIRLREI